jgi:hypothetical protein
MSTAHIQPETKERVDCRQASLGAASSPASDSTVLSLDAFVRSIGVRRGAPLALFLGAGASTSSGLPSAQTCIWEWKRQIFLTNNPGLEEQFAELSLDGVRRRIQQWLDRQGIYPKENTPEEYGFYIRQCFPIADDRRAFFAQKVREASPHAATACSACWPRPTLSARSGRRISMASPRARRRRSSLRPSRLGLTRKHASPARRRRESSCASRCTAIIATTSSRTRPRSCRRRKRSSGKR